VQFGKHFYVTVPSCHLCNKTTRCHLLEDSNIHSHCVILHDAQTPLVMSEYGYRQATSSVDTGKPFPVWIQASHFQCGYRQATSNVDTGKPLPHGSLHITRLTMYAIHNILSRSLNHSCSAKATMHSVCVLEIQVTVSCTKIFSGEQQRFYGKCMALVKTVIMWVFL
jgi:hypothetical protein